MSKCAAAHTSTCAEQRNRRSQYHTACALRMSWQRCEHLCYDQFISSVRAYFVSLRAHACAPLRPWLAHSCQGLLSYCLRVGEALMLPNYILAGCISSFNASYCVHMGKRVCAMLMVLSYVVTIAGIRACCMRMVCIPEFSQPKHQCGIPSHDASTIRFFSFLQACIVIKFAC